MFRPAPKILNCACNLAGLGIDGGDAFAAAIDAENALSLWVIDNPVRVVSDSGFIEDDESLEIEHGDRARVSGADEPVSKFPVDGNAVHALLAGNFPHDGARIEIEHNHFGTMRNIQPAAFGVGRNVVPSRIVGDGNTLDHM